MFFYPFRLLITLTFIGCHNDRNSVRAVAELRINFIWHIQILHNPDFEMWWILAQGRVIGLQYPDYGRTKGRTTAPDCVTTTMNIVLPLGTIALPLLSRYCIYFAVLLFKITDSINSILYILLHYIRDEINDQKRSVDSSKEMNIAIELHNISGETVGWG